MKNTEIMKTDFNALSKEVNSDVTKILSKKIDDYQVLCIYEQESKPVKVFNQNVECVIMKNVPVFEEESISKTFVIWEDSYQENKPLFTNLRLAARDELILRISKNIMGYLLRKFEDYLGISIRDQAKFKEKGFVKNIINKFNDILKKDTFLGNDEIWDDFNARNRLQLTDWILEEMEASIGFNKIQEMNDTRLNNVFFEYISDKLSTDGVLKKRFIRLVNDYTQEWIIEVVESMNINTISIEGIKELLEIKDGDFKNERPLLLENSDISFILIEQGNLLVMSNAPYQSVREAISKNRFIKSDATPWPTTKINKGSIEGIVQIIPLATNSVDDTALIQQAWAQSEELTEHDVDVFDALCSIFLVKARGPKDFVEIQLDDLLAIRGLKPKLGGSGRRGGYEITQRQHIMKSLSRIQSLWIDLEKVLIYKKGKAIQMKLKGRAFTFESNQSFDSFAGDQPRGKSIQFTVDEVFAQYLSGSSRQVALLPYQALQYNPYQQDWEKKIIRYLSWRWRTQARKGEYLQPHKIDTLLDAIGKEMNSRTPSRTRDRLEQALDLLLEDEIITGWHYEKWDESIAAKKGWSRIWRNATIVITPSAIIVNHYRPIERKRQAQPLLSVNQEVKASPQDSLEFGSRIRATRTNMRYTLAQLADDLEISVSYLSNIERGIKVPSDSILTRTNNWLELYE